MKIFYDIHAFAEAVNVRHRHLRRLLRQEKINPAVVKGTSRVGKNNDPRVGAGGRKAVWTHAQVEAFRQTKSFEEYERRG